MGHIPRKRTGRSNDMSEKETRSMTRWSQYANYLAGVRKKNPVISEAGLRTSRRATKSESTGESYSDGSRTTTDQDGLASADEVADEQSNASRSKVPKALKFWKRRPKRSSFHDSAIEDEWGTFNVGGQHARKRYDTGTSRHIKRSRSRDKKRHGRKKRSRSRHRSEHGRGERMRERSRGRMGSRDRKRRSRSRGKRRRSRSREKRRRSRSRDKRQRSRSRKRRGRSRSKSRKQRRTWRSTRRRKSKSRDVRRRWRKDTPRVRQAFTPSDSQESESPKRKKKEKRKEKKKTKLIRESSGVYDDDSDQVKKLKRRRRTSEEKEVRTTGPEAMVFSSAMGKKELFVMCPKCNKPTHTMVYKHPTTLAWILGATVCVLTLGLCGWLVFRYDKSYYYTHFCGNCKSFIGGFTKQCEIDVKK